jgi:hypothetical protein
MWTEGDAGTGRAIIQSHFASDICARALCRPVRTAATERCTGRFIELVVLPKPRSSTLESRVEVGQDVVMFPCMWRKGAHITTAASHDSRELPDHIFGVVPTSAQRRLCRPRDCADVGWESPRWQRESASAGRFNQSESRNARSGSGGW